MKKFQRRKSSAWLWLSHEKVSIVLKVKGRSKYKKNLKIKKIPNLRTGMSFCILLKSRIIDKEGLSDSKVRIRLKVIRRSKFKKVDPGDQKKGLVTNLNVF